MRLIPAHAGKTRRRLPTRQAEEAHPRSRGENRKAMKLLVLPRGSSPLTRGKHTLSAWEQLTTGLIPAHAGKTREPVTAADVTAAHPRSRGENETALEDPTFKAGSSPLTRGKHFPTCAFTAQTDQILETLELAVSSGSYSVWVACATDAPQDQVRSIGLVLPSSRGAS